MRTDEKQFVVLINMYDDEWMCVNVYKMKGINGIVGHKVCVSIMNKFNE